MDMYSNHNAGKSNTGSFQSQGKFTNDLSKKMFETLDLKATTNKATHSFKQPVHKVGKRPEHVVHKTSNKAANWSNLSLESEFIAPVQQQPTVQVSNPANHTNNAQWVYSGMHSQMQVPAQSMTDDDDFGNFIGGDNPVLISNIAPPTYSSLGNGNQNVVLNQSIHQPSFNSHNNFTPPQNFVQSQPNAFPHHHSKFNSPANQTVDSNITQLPQNFNNIPPNINNFGTGMLTQNTNILPAVNKQHHTAYFGLQMQSERQTNSNNLPYNNGNTGTGISNPDDFGEFVEPPTAITSDPNRDSSRVHRPMQRRDMPPDIDNDSLRKKINSPPLAHRYKSVKNATPSWFNNPSDVPELYRQVLGIAGLPSGMVETSILYPILVSSQLPQQTLSKIWSTVNKKTPGQLTFSEMFVALALVALAQKSILPLTWEKALTYDIPPLPNINLHQSSGTTKDNNIVKPASFSLNQFSNQTGLNCISQNNSYDEFGDFSDAFANPQISYTGATDTSTDWGDFNATPVKAPVNNKPLQISRKLPVNSSSSTTPGVKKNSEVNLLTNDNDKYAAFRDIKTTAAVFNAPSLFESKEDDDFADFQACEEDNKNTSTENFTKQSIDPNCEPESDLFSTWQSPTDAVQSAEVKNTSEREFVNFSSLSHNILTSSIGSSNIVNDNLSMNNDDALPHKNKIQVKSIPNPVAPTIQKPKLPSVSKMRYMSESSNEFGDFTEPPPISDSFPEDEFDIYNRGNSSLHDFDAVDHFESSIKQAKKPISAEEVKNKIESTAIDIISSTINKTDLKITKDSHLQSNQNNIESHFNNAQSLVVEQKYDETNNTREEEEDDWGSFSDDNEENNKPVIDPKWTTSSHLTMSEMIDVSLSTISRPTSENATTDKDTSIKQPVFADFGNSFVDSTSTTSSMNDLDKKEPIADIIPVQVFGSVLEMDPELSHLKERMQGTGPVDPLELYSDHWLRCLTTCKDIISSANETFGELKSAILCKEVVNSTKGRDFIADISEVYGVSRRIRSSMNAITLNSEEISALLQDIDFSWNNLLGFCPYTPSVHKTPQHCSTQATEMIKSPKFCGLCLLDTNDGDKVDYPMSISYGDRYYHAACANLWLNQVAPILPRLELYISKEV